MIIENNITKNVFSQLKTGEVFKWGGDFFMVVEKIGTRSGENAVHLETGYLTQLQPDTEIYPVNAKLVVD